MIATFDKNGQVETINGTKVPSGIIGIVGMQPYSKVEITPRALSMTKGLFEFAEVVNRKEPKQD